MTDQLPQWHLLRRLERGEIDARLVEPDGDAATAELAAIALGVDVGQIIKSLVLTNKRGDAVIAIMSGPSRLDRRKAEQLAGIGKLSFAPAELVLDVTGYPVGGVPPVAHQRQVPVFVDLAVVAAGTVYGGGGTSRLLLEITAAEIVRHHAATIADLASEGETP